MTKTIHAPRETEIKRTPLSFAQGSRFNVPQEIKDADPDHVYGFVPDNSQDDGLIEKAINYGWTEVKATENPALSQKYFNSSLRKNNDGILRKGGQVLMKIQKELYEEIQNHYADQVRSQQEEIKKASGYQDVMSNNPLLGSQGVNFAN